MKKTLIIIVVLTAILSSCNSKKFLEQNYYTNTQTQVSIGDIIDSSNKEPENNIKAKVKFTETIELSYSIKKVNRKANNLIEDAYKALGKTVEYNYLDTLDYKPSYIVLNISENLKLAELLNNDLGAKSYMATTDKAAVITQIALIFPQKDINELKKSQRMLISESKKNGQQLIYEIGSKKHSLLLSTGVVFAWRISKVCWIYNKAKYKNDIGDIIPDGKKCNDNMSKLPKERKKEYDF